MKLKESRVAEITRLHNELGQLIVKSLQNAMRIGELLVEQKARLRHGEWTPWVKENLPFSPRHSQKYMQIYAHREALKAPSMAHLSMNEAIKFINYKPRGNGKHNPEANNNSERKPRSKTLKSYEISEYMNEDFHAWLKHGRELIQQNKVLGEAVSWEIISHFLLNLNNTLNEHMAA